MEERFCKCGCETVMPETNRWEYVRGHKPGGAKKKAKPTGAKKAAKAAEPEITLVTLTVDLTEERLDQMWAALDIGSKGAAIQHTLTIEADA